MKLETGFSLADLRMQIDTAAGDVGQLERIYRLVVERPEPDAGKLRIRIAQLLKSARPHPTQNAVVGTNSPPSPKFGLWTRVLATNGLTSPDGRALHEYRLSEDQINELEQHLRNRLTLTPVQIGSPDAALFCLWAARWFGHTYRGGMRRWQELIEALAPRRLDGSAGRHMTRDGLSAWRRPVALGASSCQWLMTLAIEGGFPAGVLDEDGGWAATYLEALVARLLSVAEPNVEIARSFALQCADLARSAYRQEIFFAVAADLALTVTELRRRCDAENTLGIPNSIWLDAREPNWRAKLPISVGTETSGRLLDGLLDIAAEKAWVAGRVGVRRLLRQIGGRWSTGLRLLADGQMSREELKSASLNRERLRAFPSRVFARHVSGEIAVLDPPMEADDGWRVRPVNNRSTAAEIPFGVPVAIELRSGGRAIHETIWPGGEATRGDFHVFTDLIDKVGGGSEAELIGSSSGNYAPETLLLLVRQNWVVTPFDEASQVDVIGGEGIAGRLVLRVTGGAVLRSTQGDKYFVRAGQAGTDRDQLLLDGRRPEGFIAVDDDIDLLCGRPEIRVRQAGRTIAPRSNEIGWRSIGQRNWEKTAIPPAANRIDVGWLDAQTGFLRDRRRIVVLPGDSALIPRRVSGGVEYQVAGLPPSAFSSGDPRLSLSYSSDHFVARFNGVPSRRAQLQLRLGDGSTTAVTAHFPITSGLAHWNGSPLLGSGNLASAPKVTLADLRDLVAHADGPDRLLIRIRDRNGRSCAAGDFEWSFHDECPLRALADQLEILLDQYGDIDVHAIITLQTVGLHWRVDRFTFRLVVDHGASVRFEGPDTDSELAIVGRCVLHPETELVLGCSSAADRRNRVMPPIGKGRGGAWIVYLRDGPTVVGRPSIVWFDGTPEPATTGIGVAAGYSDLDERRAAIERRLEAVGEGLAGTSDEVQQLVNACVGLNGLPPSSLDILVHLPSVPASFARVLLAAGDQAESVLKLDEQLSILTCALPWTAWKRALELERCRVMDLFTATLGVEFDRSLIGHFFGSLAGRLVHFEPLLAWPFVVAGLGGVLPPKPRPLVEAARDFIRRHGDETSSPADCPSRFRVDVERAMPTVFGIFDESHLEALDAPCAAAAAAAGRTLLKADELRLIKAIRRLDPIYFAEAFVSRFVELSRKPPTR